MMHRDDHHVGALSNTCTSTRMVSVSAIAMRAINVLPIAVALVIGVAEKTEANAVPHKHDALMRFTL